MLSVLTSSIRVCMLCVFFFFQEKTAYRVRIKCLSSECALPIYSERLRSPLLLAEGEDAFERLIAADAEGGELHLAVTQRHEPGHVVLAGQHPERDALPVLEMRADRHRLIVTRRSPDVGGQGHRLRPILRDGGFSSKPSGKPSD